MDGTNRPRWGGTPRVSGGGAAMALVLAATVAVGGLAVAVPAAVAAGAPAPRSGPTWVLTATDVNPEGAAVERTMTDLQVRPGHLSYSYLDNRPDWDAFSSSFVATYDPPAARIAPGSVLSFAFVVSGRVTRGEDQRYTGMAVVLGLPNGSWSEPVGVSANCSRPGFNEPLVCTPPQTATGTRTVTAPSTGTTFDVTVSAQNCSACALRFRYTLQDVSPSSSPSPTPTPQPRPDRQKPKVLAFPSGLHPNAPQIAVLEYAVGDDSGSTSETIEVLAFKKLANGRIQTTRIAIKNAWMGPATWTRRQQARVLISPAVLRTAAADPRSRTWLFGFCVTAKDRAGNAAKDCDSLNLRRNNPYLTP